MGIPFSCLYQKLIFLFATYPSIVKNLNTNSFTERGLNKSEGHTLFHRSSL